MGILNPNTTSNSADGPLSIRRAVSIAAGLFCGVTLTLHCVQSNHAPASVLAEATPQQPALQQPSSASRNTYEESSGLAPDRFGLLVRTGIPRQRNRRW